MSAAIPPAAIPAHWTVDELRGLAYRCLDDCGFCCTFTPEVAHAELARLKTRFPRLQVVRHEDRMMLPFQGGCGACTLLSKRRCTAYEERPAHCRFFPFHVGFGRRTQVAVNRTCRGVEPTPGGDLSPAFLDQVLAVAKPYAFAEHEHLARKVLRDFEANAREAKVWGDVDAAIVANLDPEPGPLADALAPFQEEDVVARPFDLAPDLRWLTFEADGGGEGLQVLRMEEDGSLHATGVTVDPAAWPSDAASAAERAAERRRLAAREALACQVFDLVDASDYALSVADAAAMRLSGIEADLRTAQAVLRQLGQAAPGELARFYDARFLDAPTIGGWL
jgi:Fe-S-cluster containining protein